MLLRLLKLCYRKEKDMTVAAALSRDYLPEAETETETLENISMFDTLAVTPDRYLDFSPNQNRIIRSL